MLQMTSPPTTIDLKDIQQAEKTLEEFGAIFKQATNVHLHTKKLGQACTRVFLKLDNQYQLSKGGQTLAMVEADILKFSGNNANVKKVLASIKHPKARKDLETGLNVQDLLIRTWTLACQANNDANARELVIDNLIQNIATKGGCLPGIAARLVQPYSHFVLNKLQTRVTEALLGTPEQTMQSIIPAAAAAAASTPRDEEAELALAITESLLISAPSAIREEKKTFRNTLPVVIVEQDKTEEDDEEMRLAKALSLSMMPK